MPKETLYSDYTYREFLDFVKNTPHHSSHSHRSSNDRGSSFSGTSSLEEALDLAYNGWDAGLKQLKLEDGIAVNGGIEFTENVHGSVVNIGNYLQGLPTCMYETTEKREYNLEELTIYIPVSFNANNSEEKAMRYCKTIINLVNKYQSNHNVRLISFFDIDETQCRCVTQVIVKDFDQRFVINNIAFSFHPSFLRRLWFKWLETHPSDFIAYGYGQAKRPDAIKERFDKEIANGKMKLRGKTILIPQIEGCNYDGTFEEDKLIKYKF